MASELVKVTGKRGRGRRPKVHLPQISLFKLGGKRNLEGAAGNFYGKIACLRPSSDAPPNIHLRETGVGGAFFVATLDTGLPCSVSFIKLCETTTTTLTGRDAIFSHDPTGEAAVVFAS